MYLTTTYHFQSKIHYESTLSARDKAIAVRFDVETAVKQDRFTLLHSVNDDEFEVIHIPIHVKDSLADPKQNIRVFRRDINPGEACVTQMGSLPDEFYDVLRLGEKYVLLWPGGNIEYWNWDPKNDHIDKFVLDDLTKMIEGRETVLPATSAISFTVSEHDEAWPGREEFAKTHSRADTNFAEWQWRAGRVQLPRRSPSPMLEIRDRM